MAMLVRGSHLSLPAVLVTIHLASIWISLFASWLIACRCYASRSARAGAVLLMALCLTVPIAGTSLILMDPYVTARSISFPCTLFALAGVLGCRRTASRRRRLQWIAIVVASLLIAVLMHPLMGGYGLGAAVLLACLLSSRVGIRRWGSVSLCLGAIGIAGVLQLTAAPEPAAYLPIALSRYYWFLSRWQWYEVIGLVAPLTILCTVMRAKHIGSRLSLMAGAAGTTALVIVLFFAHARYSTHLVARLQPLRMFQLVYVVMILTLGGWLGEYVLRTNAWRWFVTAAFVGATFFAVQRSTYPASSYIEWPGFAPRNAWEQAFIWVSPNTPVDALFALDSRYISIPGEDAQCFRALAERSALPDYSKDGGEASITPALTTAWTIGRQAQAHLSEHTDAEREAALRPLNVTWVVLQREAKTGFDCPFQNGAVQVCRLP